MKKREAEKAETRKEVRKKEREENQYREVIDDAEWFKREVVEELD